MELKVEYVNPRELKPYASNARKHAPTDIESIKKSILAFGFIDPIGIWQGNVIVEGHGRYIAALELGLELVPCIRLDELTDTERRAYALAHNKTAEQSEWSIPDLEMEIAALQIIGIDMEDFGFDCAFTAEGLTDSLTLKDGDKDDKTTMTFTLSHDQAGFVRESIARTMDDGIYQLYVDPNNTDPLGNAIYAIAQWTFAGER